MDAAADSEIVRRPPSPRVAHLISAIAYYRERGRGLVGFRHAAPLALPLLFNLGSPFRIALGRQPGSSDRQPSFAAGLFPGPVLIESDGRAECIQVDFTPLGAYRFYGGAVTGLTAHMANIEDVLGHDGRRLCERIAKSRSCEQRFVTVEEFIRSRAVHQPSAEIATALDTLAASAGTARVRDMAAEIGWSRKHFGRRFLNEVGVPPKTLARMLRFHRACKLARNGAAANWAIVAAEAGYADQRLLREAGG